MYIKVNNGVIEKYPYSASELMWDNPQVSFPQNISDALLTEWGVLPVTVTEKPQIDHTQNILEGQPQLIDGNWTQIWEVTDASSEEITERLAELTRQAEQNRAIVYRNESDPLFFKWQRGECTQQEWLDKVAEIKAKYPKP